MNTDKAIGYYLVKFYNYERKYVMYFTGQHFEGFRSEQMPFDEIESYEPFSVENIKTQLQP